MIAKNQKSFGKVAKKGVAWSFLREGVTEILLFPSSMIVARLLTPTEFGLTSAALFFIQLSARLSDLGFNAALVRSKTVTAAHFASVFIVNLGVGVLAYLLLVGLSPAIASFYDAPETGKILPVAALSFLIAPFGAVPGAMLTRDMRFREGGIVDWNYCLTFAVLSIVLAWMGFSYWSLVYARVASVGAQVLTRIYFTRWRPAFQFSWPALKEILSFGLGMHARRLLDYSAGNLDNLVVGKVMGMHALGIYDKAFSTTSRFLARMNAGGPSVMFRIFALIHEEPERFRRAYSRVVMSATILGFPILAGMIVAAPQLITVLFGSNWIAAVVPFQILCVAGFPKVINQYASAATQAAGLVWAEVTRQAIYVALIVGGIVAFGAWGPAGAAIAVVIATGVMTLLMHTLLKRVTKLSWLDILKPQAPGVFCAIAVAAGVSAAAFGLRAAFAPSDFVLLVVQVATGMLIYVLFVLFAPHAALRALVHEMITDMAPAFLKRHRLLQWHIRLNETYARSQS